MKLTPDYLFESFLPYRESLNLERALYSLIKIKKLLNQDRNIEEQILERASFNVRYLLPSVKPANMSEEDFKKTLQKEQDEKSMSEEELKDKLELESEQIREKIESGEIDIWDDSPNFISSQKAKAFFDHALQSIEDKIVRHCRPEASFFEKMVCAAISMLQKEGGDSQAYGQLQALIQVWDYAKIAHENEPPYKIVFSEQVAEQLGIDPIMESIRLQNLRPLTPKEKRRLKKFQEIASESVRTHDMQWVSKEELDAIYKMAQRKEIKNQCKVSPQEPPHEEI